MGKIKVWRIRAKEYVSHLDVTILGKDSSVLDAIKQSKVNPSNIEKVSLIYEGDLTTLGEKIIRRKMNE